MKLHNSLTKTVEDFTPQNNNISIYSCGPTVYNNLTIGNLSAFIYADLLRRVLSSAFPDNSITHVMNVTDVDDKTIRDSKQTYPDEDPMQALLKFTRQYEEVFMGDMAKVGNDLSSYSFIRATDSIKEMQNLILELYEKGMAYLADDGIYFSIEAYQKAGKKYGQLVELEKSTDTKSRIQNDEYDKDSANDFALWKTAKPGEPSWEFKVGEQDVSGRPGWHIECSAMSRKLLGKEFDIHTGGIDLKFPHHENEIAQSTACTESPVMAKFFMHNDHMLVDGVKMSKSLGNFYTLRDVEEKGYDPLAFRLLVLQGHYTNSVNFSWDNLEAAQNRLNRWKNIAAIRWQDTRNPDSDMDSYIRDRTQLIAQELANDLNVASGLRLIEELFDHLEDPAGGSAIEATIELYQTIDKLLGIDILATTPDISAAAKGLLNSRRHARENKDWSQSDILRDELKRHGIDVRDAQHGQIWSYATSIIDSEYFCL